jgi:hypothetical protein
VNPHGPTLISYQITQIIKQKPNGGDVEGRGGLWEEHVGGVELVSKLLGWSGTRSGKRDR